MERTLNFEREQVLRELRANDFNMNEAAEALGLERSHLYKKMRALGLKPKREEDESDDG